MRFAEEEIPKAELASLHLEFFNDGNDGLPPCRVVGELGLGQPLSRPDLLLQRYSRMSYRDSSVGTRDEPQRKRLASLEFP